MVEFDGDWRDKAACNTVDPELFFPTSETTRANRDQVKRAKVVCGLCRVTEQCLQYALETGQGFGIWGGLTESERKELKRRARQQKVVRELMSRSEH